MNEDKIRLQLSSIGGLLIEKGYLGDYPESIERFVEEVVNDCYSFFFVCCFITSATVRYSDHFTFKGDLFWYKLYLNFTDNEFVSIRSVEIWWQSKKHIFVIPNATSLLPVRFVMLIWDSLTGPRLLCAPRD